MRGNIIIIVGSAICKLFRKGAVKVLVTILQAEDIYILTLRK